MIFLAMIGLISFYCYSGNLSCPNFTRKEDKFGAKSDKADKWNGDRNLGKQSCEKFAMLSRD